MSKTRMVLLIDYDPESIESTRGPLVKAGYEVEVASDGIAGLEAFERLKPDLVLIEPMVPKKHGFQVCQEIKSTTAGRNTPVLITTAFYRGRKHRTEARESYGCDDYLEKPIAEALLLSTCGKFLIDTDEPPIPVGHEQQEVAAPAEPVSTAPDTGVPTDLVMGMPDIPFPHDKKTSRLPALDDLSEDEIQERLDAMIIADDDLPAVDSPEARPPAPLEAAEPAATVAEPFATADSPARSRLPLWIGIAAGVLIVAGAGMLWLLRDKGAGDPSIEVAGMSSGVAPSPSPRETPRRNSAIFPTVPVLEITEPESESEAVSVAGPVVSGPARPVVDPAPTAVEQIPAPTPSAPEPKAVASAVGTRARPVSDPPGGPGSATASGAAAAGGPSDNREPADDAMADSRGMSAEPEAETEAETETALPSSDVPDPAIDEAPSTVSESPTTQQAPPVIPVPANETDPVIAPAAEPAVPKTRSGDLVGLNEVDEAPVARDKPTPQYPAGARSMRQEGTVNLRLLVDELGRVEQVEIDSGTRSKLLQRAAVKAAERWVYEPGIKDGVPVKVWIKAAVTFKL